MQILLPVSIAIDKVVYMRGIRANNGLISPCNHPKYVLISNDTLLSTTMSHNTEKVLRTPWTHQRRM